MENSNSKPIKKEALEFIFEYTKGAPEVQLRDVEALDNKVIQILSVSSVIIGLIVLVIGNDQFKLSSPIPLIIALLAYAALAISAFIHLKGEPFRRSIQADILWDIFQSKNVEDIKHSLVVDISKAYAFNKAQIRKKKQTLLAVVICAAIEVVTVGVFIFSSVV